MKFVTVKNYLSKIVKNYLTFTPAHILQNQLCKGMDNLS